MRSNVFRTVMRLLASLVTGAVALPVQAQNLSPNQSELNFRFSTASFRVNEAVSSVTLTVERILVTMDTELVSFTSAGGTATTQRDYGAVEGVLTFGPGVGIQSIVVPIIDDSADEDSEDFVIALSDPARGERTGVTANVTIDDNDSVPVLNITGCRTVEGNPGDANSCTFVAILMGTSSKDVTFTTRTINGMDGFNTYGAIAPGDYTAHSSMTHTIPAGGFFAAISVPVVGEWLREPDEVFSLAASNLVNANPGTVSATGTIADDDINAVPDAAFVSQLVPTQMDAGKTYSVRITMRNSGATLWSSGKMYWLRSATPPGVTSWNGDGRVMLPNDVAPNTNVDFYFDVVAPILPGAYDFQWGMIRHGNQPFGNLTANVEIEVIDRLFVDGFDQR